MVSCISSQPFFRRANLTCFPFVLNAFNLPLLLNNSQGIWMKMEFEALSRNLHYFLRKDPAGRKSSIWTNHPSILSALISSERKGSYLICKIFFPVRCGSFARVTEKQFLIFLLKVEYALWALLELRHFNVFQDQCILEAFSWLRADFSCKKNSSRIARRRNRCFFKFQDE